ncbi:SagB/ThcOx family dehydrogenase [Hoyosella altamirensis]|uniref:SagB-type dehydrogenase family enzyme n=1 Tax=Hoyosella altamirensis TaxID=616997 RepID=A0A839RK68_9ACTN|nr:SagB/ThcOx family dehydrogenase [Hoyosella altamirensis]MBB3036699.1 SagB-type dehydrogenase family enzyme [Hoyosella altamirensis]
MPEIKTADHAVMFTQDGKIVWDDYVNHRQFALTDESLRIVRWFGVWRELESIGTRGSLDHAIASRLLEEGVLVEYGSDQHVREEQLTKEWGRWGRGPEYQHFSARTTTDARFYSVIEDEMMSVDRALSDPPPSPWRTFDDAPVVPVAQRRPDDSAWMRPRLVDALYGRRSVRQFTQDAAPLEQLGIVAQLAVGAVEVIDHPALGQVVLKTSPSAGARSPIELYLYSRNVDGLDEGLYHFAAHRGGFERIGAKVAASEMRAAVGDQPWLSECAALFVYTAVLERTSWRYASARAYRDILIEVGHISQTVLVSASALGLGAVTATAVRDELLERMIGADPAAEPVLGVTALGIPLESA